MKAQAPDEPPGHESDRLLRRGILHNELKARMQHQVPAMQYLVAHG